MEMLSKTIKKNTSFEDGNIVLKKPIIALDLEFAALEVNIFRQGKLRKTFKTFEIIEMGMVRFDASGESDSFETFVKPKFHRFKIDEKVKELTGIQEKQLRRGILIEQAYREFLKYYIPGKTLLLTWGNGDLPVLKHVCEKNKLPYVIREEDFIDISKEFHVYFGIEKPHQYSLKKTLNFFNIEEDIKHRATSDARAALEVFFQLMRDAEQKQHVKKAE